MSKEKTKFKDTGFGKLLLQTIPSAGALVGDLLPDAGVLGMVKNLIGGAKDRGEITPEQAVLLNAKADRELEYYRIDQEDRASARTRQQEIAKTGKFDLMFMVSGMFALLSAVAVVIVVLFFEIKSGKELFFFVAGAAFGWAGQVITFHYGSSKGSKDKDLPRS